MKYFKFVRWWFRSFRREFHKKKYYAICRFFWDADYRRDIMHIAHITTEYRLRAVEGRMMLGLINPSHDINYPEWVDELEEKISMYNAAGIALDPIKVMWDWTVKRWCVIDGNHRLRALNRVFGPMMDVDVIFLVSDNPASVDAYHALVPGFRKQSHFSVEGSVRTQ
jgi:hypothetical protein